MPALLERPRKTWTNLNLNRALTLDQIVEELIPKIEQALDAYSLPEPGCPARLGEAIRYSLLAPGKRLRPSLVLMAAEACRGSVDQAIPAAVAVEMVHAYSLIHDDLPAMDDDDLRRGRPTCHVKFDEATAILAGDALLARSFEVLASGLPSTIVPKAIKVLARAAGPTALVGGQADDLSDHGLMPSPQTSAPERRPIPSHQAVGASVNSSTSSSLRVSPTTGGPPQAQEDLVQQLESIHRRKTGALFSASIALGGISVGASAEQMRCLEEYAENFGLSFQIVDDLLDFLGTSEEVGTRTGKDIQLGKLTFPGILGVENSRRRAEQLTSSAIEAISLLGDAGGRLTQLAQFVLQRSR